MYQSENQLHPALLGICSLNFAHQHSSASRIHMLSNHLGQMLVLKGSTVRRLQTGMERQYGKFTFNVKMPANGEILHIIDRYRKTLGRDSIDVNPQTIVVYEDEETKTIGIINLTGHCSNHQYFGFKYAEGKDYAKLFPGSKIAKDAVFLESPSITDEGDYKYGLQGNVVYATLPCTAEDGVGICRDFLPKMGIKIYESRIVEWGSKKCACNLYPVLDAHGNVTGYKAYPDIGERIREDGLLMALRSYDPPELAVVEQGIQDLREVDYMFDTKIYANGPGGKVVDIRLHHQLNRRNHAEVNMDAQSQKYDDARRAFYSRILDVWKKLYRDRGDALQITPEFSRLVVEAQSVVSEVSEGQGVVKMYRKAPLDDYWIEFIIEYDVIPTTGFKITDLHGGSGL